MKSINPSVLRATVALVIGFVLVKWPGLALNYIIITLGAIFLIPSIVGMISYYFDKKSPKSPLGFPIEYLGGLLFGLVLIITPKFFANILTILLGIMLFLGAFQQVLSLIMAQKWSKIGFGYYIVPVLILLSGIYVTFYPSEAQETTLLVIGWTSIVYGAFELIKWFMVVRKQPDKDPIQDAVEYIDNNLEEK